MQITKTRILSPPGGFLSCVYRLLREMADCSKYGGCDARHLQYYRRQFAANTCEESLYV